MKSVAIIVLNWNKPQLTIDTVNSLLKINYQGFSYNIIIVDNGSSDNSIDVLNSAYSANKLVTLICTQSNLGFVDGNNYGIKHALKNKFTHVLVINNDVIVDPKFLQILIDYQSQHPQYHLLGPKIYFAPGHEYHQQRYSSDELGKVIWSAGGKMDWNNIIGSNVGIDEVDTGQFNQPTDQVDFLSGCCLLIDTKVLKKIGLFDSRYFMYLEDSDFCRRALNQQFKLIFVPQSVIWHINAGSSGAGGNLHDYFITRNRLLFAFIHAKLRTKLAIIRESIRIYFTSPSVWQKRGVLDFYLQKFNKGSWR